MLTENPITKEKVRGFIVIACRVKGKKLKDSKAKERLKYERETMTGSHYPYFSGPEAIKTMQTLNDRGFDVVAYTKVNFYLQGENEENLTLEEMKEM